MRGIRELSLICITLLLAFCDDRSDIYGPYAFYSDTSVSIVTSRLKNAGADGRVYLKLHYKNNATKEIPFPQDFINGVIGEIIGTGVFTDGSTTTFDIPEADPLEGVDFVEVFHRPPLYCLEEKWRPQLLKFIRKSLDGAPFAVIPIDRYLKPRTRYLFANYDANLPQNDPLPEQRKMELMEARQKYEYDYTNKIKDFPPKVKTLPFEQSYTNAFLVKMFKSNFVVGAVTNMESMMPDRNFTSFEDMASIFDGKSLRMPKYVEGFRDDVWFGRQRVQGGSPVLIQLINKIPDKLGVTPELVEDMLENLTLSDALSQNRIFMTDLVIFDGIRALEKINMTEPIALFYLNEKKDLMPIAIQLFQKKNDDNPVFTPRDNKYTWLLAKFFYNLAESTYHQAVAHLSHTHYLMEPIIINTYRNLAPSHPVHRLLTPHFIFTLAINRLAMQTFANEAKVDAAMNACSRGMMRLVSRGYNQWNLTRVGTIKNLFKENRVTKDILPYYPYRDDIIEVYDIVHRYVSKIIHLYYDGEEIKYDKEIQAWRNELSLSKKKGGLGLKGIPGSDKKGLRTLDELIETVTGIIFTASGWHASVNFLMYDVLAFAPNFPVYLRGEIPTDKRPRTYKEVMSYMPSSHVAFATITIANSLAIRDTNSLGYFEVPKLYHPKALQAVKELQDESDALSEKITALNKVRPVPYPWADPTKIPNAISV